MAATDNYDDPYDQPYPTQTPTAPTAAKRFNTTPAWQDPVNAPKPTDQYYAEWQAANPGIPESAAAPIGPQLDVYGNPYGAPKAHGDDPGTTPTPTPTTAPTPTTPGGPGPAPTPSVAPPVPTPPPAFHYDDFTAPDPNDLSSDPGFQFENAQGMQAIGARNAALGTLNTGGTLKDYVSFGQNLAHTRYGDLFNRKLTQYGTNRGNALDAYNVNYGTQVKDPWNEAMQRASLDQNTNQFNSTQDFNKWLENYKRSTLDPFDQRYKTLSLL